MKRFGTLVGGVLLASLIAGCDGGIEEGPPKEGATDPQPADFKAYMQKNAGKMGAPKKPGGGGASKAAPAAPAEPATPEKK